MHSVLNSKTSIMKKRYRIQYLDTAKGIGIILVVFCHVINIVSVHSELLHTCRDCVYSFHMPLFFIISGILLSKHIYNLQIDSCLKESIKKKTSQLLVPYIKWSIIYILLLTLNFIYQKASPTNMIMERGYATITGRGIVPLWFLLALFEAETCVILCFYAKRKKSFNHNLIMWLITFGLLSCLCSKLYQVIASVIMSPLVDYWIISLFRIPLSVFFVLIGVSFNSYLNKSQGVSAIVETSILLLSLCLWFTLIIVSHNHVNMHLFRFDSIAYFMLTGITGSLVIILISKKLGPIQPICKIGKDSLIIMLLHYPPIPFITLVSLVTTGINELYRVFIITIAVILIIEAITKMRQILMNQFFLHK